MGLEVLDFSRSITGQRSNESASPPRQIAERFGTASYVSVVHAKTRCIISKLSRLAQHADARVDVLLFFVDGDVTLFGDPRPHFAAMGVELALMSDRRGFGGACGLPPRNTSATRMVFNSGFFLLRVGPAALWLWSTVQDYHRHHPQVMQQAALNAVLDDKRYWPPSEDGVDPHQRTLGVDGVRLRLAVLDEATFLNGHCFYQRRPLRIDAANVMAVHHNFIDGDGRKFERARAYHATLDESDKTWEAFARRSRAAMNANASWDPAGERNVFQGAWKDSIRGRKQCGGNDAFEASWSPLRQQCHKKRYPQMKPFCRSRVPPALWAANGAGIDWLRVVLELVTGYSTGSVVEDRALAALLPSENWPWETPEECGSMLVLATRGLLEGPPWTQIACGGAVSRAIFLVRHPFGVAWASWNPNRLGSVQGRRWPAYAEHTVRKWVYLMDYPNLRVDNAYRVWMRERSAHLWVRLEDLLEGGRAEYELRRVLDFVLDGQYRVGGRVVRCALQKATATLRAANRAEKEDCVVVHGGAPNCCAQCAMRRAFEHTFERGNHGRGQSALPSTTTNRSVGDAVWKVAEGVAPNFGYTRQGYTALGPHSRPSLGAQSSTAQLLECDCPEH